MDQTITKIQAQIIQLLPADLQNQPFLLADSCSEVTRVVAQWIKQLNNTCDIAILKGDHVCGTQKSHDILAVTTNDRLVYVIDPTIWQFFCDAQSILVLKLKDGMLDFNKIKEKYGGDWSQNEIFTQLTEEEEKEYLDIITQNIMANITELKKGEVGETTET